MEKKVVTSKSISDDFPTQQLSTERILHISIIHSLARLSCVFMFHAMLSTHIELCPMKVDPLSIPRAPESENEIAMCTNMKRDEEKYPDKHEVNR